MVKGWFDKNLLAKGFYERSRVHHDIDAIMEDIPEARRGGTTVDMATPDCSKIRTGGKLCTAEGKKILRTVIPSVLHYNKYYK